MPEKNLIMPKSRVEGLVIQELEDETLVYDLTNHRAHCLNSSIARIWRSCDGRTSIEEIARTVEAEFQEAPGEPIVLFAVDQLGKARLLENRIDRKLAVGMSRRSAIRKLGVAAAIALPLITSIVAPEAAMAASCTGSPINANACNVNNNGRCCNRPNNGGIGTCTNGSCV